MYRTVIAAHRCLRCRTEKKHFSFVSRPIDAKHFHSEFLRKELRGRPLMTLRSKGKRVQNLVDNNVQGVGYP